jgi:ribbon-helix-helix CopG family protein
VRVTPSLLDELSLAANAERRSRSNLIRKILSQWAAAARREQTAHRPNGMEGNANAAHS